MSVISHDVSLSFREVLARVCSPVCVVTAMVDGRPHGTTVSAFTSLSLHPPMVLVSLDSSSDLLHLIKASNRFGVNVLGHDSRQHAQNFARKGSDKFASVEWVEDDGLPRLPMALGWLSCDVAGMFTGGDHHIVLGEVRAAYNRDGRPLTYFLREFGTHSSVEDEQ